MQTVHKFVKRKKFLLLSFFSRLNGIKDYSVSNLLSLALYQVLIFFCLTRRGQVWSQFCSTFFISWRSSQFFGNVWRILIVYFIKKYNLNHVAVFRKLFVALLFPYKYRCHSCCYLLSTSICISLRDKSLRVASGFFIELFRIHPLNWPTKKVIPSSFTPQCLFNRVLMLFKSL